MGTLLTDEQIEEGIESEGFAYFFLDYASPSGFGSDTQRLVYNFRTAQQMLDDHLHERGIT